MKANNKEMKVPVMSKRRIVTSSDESDISITRFHSSVSHFREREEKALRIRIHLTDNFNDIIDIPPRKLGPTELSLELQGFHPGDIATFNPSLHEGLNVDQVRFLNKLRLVITNNDLASEESSFEKFIDDLVLFLYDRLGFDDGRNITMRPCNLRLVIGEESFAAHTDREGRRGTEVVWLTSEDKHVSSGSYKKGEVQLVCCMIAAYQHNYSVLDGDIHPPRMIGIRIVGEKFYFYSLKASKDYIEELFDGLPEQDLIGKRYPSGSGLSLADPDERARVIRCLCHIRDYALGLQ